MSKDKPTPRPWTYESEREQSFDSKTGEPRFMDWHKVVGDDGTPIYHSIDLPSMLPHSGPNAHLVVRAVNLLDEVVSTLEQVLTWNKECGMVGADELRDLIAKARGNL